MPNSFCNSAFHSVVGLFRYNFYHFNTFKSNIRVKREIEKTEMAHSLSITDLSGEKLTIFWKFSNPTQNAMFNRDGGTLTCNIGQSVTDKEM